MSAIFGIISLNNNPVQEQHLQLMQNKISHYGRDIQQFNISGAVGLGCCLDKFGRQSQNDIPVFENPANGKIIVCDAQLYNKEELAAGCGLVSDKIIPNQQLLLAAYEKWGNAFPQRVNGDFTCAIWNEKHQQLLLARDQLGVRPLYYCHTPQYFCFATDYRALLALPFVNRALDEVQVYAHISNTYHINPEATPFEHIRRLPAAHTVMLTNGRIKKTKYWRPGGSGKTLCRNEAEYCQKFFALVHDAVLRRVSYFDGGIGAELSGGMDSTVVDIFASQQLKKTGKELPVYSWTPPCATVPGENVDERVLVEAVCAQENFSCQYLDRTVLECDIGDNAPLLPPRTETGKVFFEELQWFSNIDARRILSGHGGDEGASHRASLWELLRNGCPGAFLSEIRRQSGRSPLRFCKLLVASTILRLFRPFGHFSRINSSSADFTNRSFARRMKPRCKRAVLQFSSKPEAYIESGATQSRTEVTAWIGAYFGTQHLFPLLDYRVVDYALSIPRHWHYKNGVNRYLYRKTFLPILPPEFNINLPKYHVTMSDESEQLRARQLQQKAAAIAARLDYNLFGEYIDQTRLQNALNNCPDFDAARFLIKKLSWCHNLQRLLNDS